MRQCMPESRRSQNQYCSATTLKKQPGTQKNGLLLFLFFLSVVMVSMLLMALFMGIFLMAMPTAAFIVVFMPMMVTAGTFAVMFLLVVMSATAFAVMFLLVVMSATAFVVMFMLMMVTAAAFAVMVMLMMTATTFAVMVILMMTATTFVAVLMLVVMSAVAFMGMRMFVMLFAVVRLHLITGIDFRSALHRSGNSGQFRNQFVRILRRQPQLFGGKGNGCLLHLGMIIEFLLDLSRAIGAIQILDDIYFSGHGSSSHYFHI